MWKDDKMKYKSVHETAVRWGVSERIVRRYCTEKRIPGAVQIDKAWRIPANAVKPGTTPPPKQDMWNECSEHFSKKVVQLPVWRSAGE